MESHLFNRLRYLRQNYNYLSEKEQAELAGLESQYQAEQYKLRNPELPKYADEEDFSDFGVQREENSYDYDDDNENEERPSFSRMARRQLYSRNDFLNDDEDDDYDEETDNPDNYYNDDYNDYDGEAAINSKRPSRQPSNFARNEPTRQSLKPEKAKKSKYKPNGKKRRHVVRNLLLFLALLLLVLLTVGGFVLADAQKTLAKTYVNTPTKSVVNPMKPFSVLLMGVDTGDATRGGSGSWIGNSDSQIVMTLNPKTSTTTMVSLERDTMTPILDQNANKVAALKMNAAYPMGYNNGGIAQGAEYAMNTISAQAGIPINSFVIINMDGLVNLVNDVGGIDVVNDSGGVDALQGTNSGTITLPTGEQVASGAIYISNTESAYKSYVPYFADHRIQHLNGEQALVFARDRDTLPNGDYGRAAHQREVLAAVFKKLMTLGMLVQYHKILSDVSGDFKTNIPMNTANMLSFLAFKGSLDKTVSVQYQGVSAMAAGSDGVSASYQLMPANVDLAVQNLLRKSVGLATSNQLGQNVITFESYFNQDASGYYMPSAQTSQKGSTKTVEGVDTNGSFVPITSSNAGDYVSASGGNAGN